MNLEEVTSSEDLEFLETFSSKNLPETDAIVEGVKSSIFTFVPVSDGPLIKEELQKTRGVTLVEPNRLDISRSEIEARILKGMYEFNMDVVNSITIVRVVEGEYNVHIDAGEGYSPIDLEIGSETSSFEDIPPEWLLQKA